MEGIGDKKFGKRENSLEYWKNPYPVHGRWYSTASVVETHGLANSAKRMILT